VIPESNDPDLTSFVHFAAASNTVMQLRLQARIAKVKTTPPWPNRGRRVDQRIVAGSQSAIWGKTINKIVVATIASIKTLVPL
jgi:hypothetical protein